MRTRLFKLNKERGDIIKEVVDRVLSGRLQAAWESQEHGLEFLISEAAYFELSLWEGAKTRRDREQVTFWHNVAVTASHNGEDQNADLLASLVQRYAQDIVGQCNRTIFHLVSRFAPIGLNALFNLQRPAGLLGAPKRWSERILVQGEIDRIRPLSKLGTLVFAPTQTSHLDPVLLGWALEQACLPPAAYGAGKDLFTRRVSSFFMRNLGAYKFDRRLKHSLYREVLRTTAQVLLERGFHSIFFPGGSRSRDGRIEQHLREELLEPALGAYVESLVRGEPKPVFIVPVTINYHLVLEAETLIGNHLRADSPNRATIESDEFSDVTRISMYAMATMGRDNAVAITFCPPLDPFGNEVDEQGRSRDRKGRLIDPSKYVETAEGPRREEHRDGEYIRALADRILESYRHNNVLFSVSLVSLAIFELIVASHTRWNDHSTIRFGRGEFISREELTQCCEQLLVIARSDASKGLVRLGPRVHEMNAVEMLDEAYRYYRMYHATPLIKRRGNGFELLNMELLYYYGNRARGYDFEKRLRRS